MTRASGTVITPCNSARGETETQEFVNSNSAPELLRQQAASLLNNKELLRNVQRLSQDDRTKFVEKVDQVCRDSQYITRCSF